jgi:hypothetical protein
MIDSYWDLYVAYIAKCVRDNWVNDIDPAHYEMEWNHFLPKHTFGDWPVGQWLTKKQHAIATALQTLALNKNFICYWHIEFLPKSLWGKCKPTYSRERRNHGISMKKDQKGIFDPHHKNKLSVAGTEVAHRNMTNQVGIFSPNFKYPEGVREQTGAMLGQKMIAEKKGIFDPKNKGKWKDVERENGLSNNHFITTQLWESTEDGFVSNAGTVARHNKSRGWDPNARKRVN